MFRNRTKFRDSHHGTPFCNNTKQCKHWQLHIFYFRAKVFYKFKWPLHNVLSSSELQPMWAGLLGFRSIFDDIAWVIFHHSSYERDGKVIWLGGDFHSWLWWLIFWHHRTSKVRSSSMPWRCGNRRHQSFWEANHKCWWLYDTLPCGSSSRRAKDYFRLGCWRFFHFQEVRQRRSSLWTLRSPQV